MRSRDNFEKFENDTKNLKTSDARNLLRKGDVNYIFAESALKARKEFINHEKGEVHYYKKRGRCAELFVKAIRHGSIDMNKEVKSNFPVFDIVHQGKFYSIKIRGLPGREPPVANYAHDLRLAIGATPRPLNGRSSGLELAAIELLKCRYNSESWRKIARQLPPEVRQTTDIQAVKKSIIANTYLLIPSDHVNAVRNYIRQVARSNPGNYGLSDNLTEQELDAAIDQLCDRIKPIHDRINISHFTKAFRISSGE